MPSAPEPSPLSIFGQALTLSDASPASSCAAGGLTPGITPEMTTRKPRRGSRLGRSVHGAAAVPTTAAADVAGGPSAAGVTSPGVAAFLREQALRDAARRGLPIASDAFLRPETGRPGLPKAPLANTAAMSVPGAATSQLTSHPAAGFPASGFAVASAAGSRQPLQEPAQCLTPPRPQRPPVGGLPPDAVEARLNRVRPPPAPPGAAAAPSKPALSLDRTSSLSRSSSGSAFSRASSLNDAKVCVTLHPVLFTFVNLRPLTSLPLKLDGHVD